VDRKAWPLDIRPSDLLLVAAVIVVIELNVVVGGGAGAAPLDALSYTLGAVIALPLLVHRRWPRAVLLITLGLMLLFYIVHRRNISPAPLMVVPVYDTALAGYLAWAIAVPAAILVAGLFAVGLTAGGMQPVDLAAEFLPAFAIFTLAVALGEVVRSRRALAAETARRLALAGEEQRSEAARVVAEERLRIARELHDTVAHSMATITVQAGSALHVLSPVQDGEVREALLTIRETSKSALGEMRAVLGQLREGAGGPGAVPASPPAPGLGLDRLPELRAAVAAAGSPVRVSVEGEPGPLAPAVDHAAYRILQESLTNVLRHAVSGTEAEVGLRYAPDSVTITVANDGCVSGGEPGTGNGLRGMRERAAAAGGELEAGPRPDGGFLVTAKLPREQAALPGRREHPDSPRTEAPA